MGWTWRYADPTGASIESTEGTEGTELPAPSFPTQADAESWIGETWQELFDGGVDAVFLLDDQTVVYGPMSQRPPP
jgi:hypothetical protein